MARASPEKIATLVGSIIADLKALRINPPVIMAQEGSAPIELGTLPVTALREIRDNVGRRLKGVPDKLALDIDDRGCMRLTHDGTAMSRLTPKGDEIYSSRMRISHRSSTMPVVEGAQRHYYPRPLAEETVLERQDNL